MYLYQNCKWYVFILQTFSLQLPSICLKHTTREQLCLVICLVPSLSNIWLDSSWISVAALEPIMACFRILALYAVHEARQWVEDVDEY